MRLNRILYGIIVVGLFLGVIYVAQGMGIWSVSGKVTASGEKVEPTGVNVAEIKGWMTLGDVAAAYKVPLDQILVAFNLPADTLPTKPIKELESDTFSPAKLRMWLTEWLSRAPSRQ